MSEWLPCPPCWQLGTGNGMEATSTAGHMTGQAAACCPSVQPHFPLLPKGHGAQEGYGTVPPPV